MRMCKKRPDTSPALAYRRRKCMEIEIMNIPSDSAARSG